MGFARIIGGGRGNLRENREDPAPTVGVAGSAMRRMRHRPPFAPRRHQRDRREITTRRAASFMLELQIITFLSIDEICYRILGRGGAEQREYPPKPASPTHLLPPSAVPPPYHRHCLFGFQPKIRG